MAATALGKYLVKLDTVAKLEPCGVHYLENDPGTTDDIVYVVARTAGTNRSYYWRRREYGYWTPWEQIKLDVEDNPVIPLVWKSRLFLFWLRILQQPDPAAPKPFPDADNYLTALHTKDINTSPPQVSVQAVLCWSEYYNGAWQPTRTSDSRRPTTVGTFGPADFDRSALRLSASSRGDALQIGISGQGDGSSWFLLYNTHSLPVPGKDTPGAPSAPGVVPGASSDLRLSPGSRRPLSVADGTLTATYARSGVPAVLDHPILKNPIDGSTVEPTHVLADPWDAPFFYSDSRYSFYVTTQQRPVAVREWDGYGSSTPPPSVLHIPPVVLQPPALVPDRIGPVISGHDSGISEPGPVERFVTEDAYIK